MSNIFYIFIENSLQCVDFQIQKNYTNWQKTAEKYTRSKEHGEYLLSDIVLGILEKRDIAEKTCEDGFLDAYVRRMLWQRKNVHRKSQGFVELSTQIADEESDEATIFDTEIMMGCIDLATGSLPKFDRELIRAYRMGLKPQEIAEIIEVDPKEVQDKLRIVKAKLKRRIKVTEP